MIVFPCEPCNITPPDRIAISELREPASSSLLISLPEQSIAADTANADASADLLELIADRLEIDFDAAALYASGSVEARWKEYQLKSRELRFDQRYERGSAWQNVELRFSDYLLQSGYLNFDLRNAQATANAWKGTVTGRGLLSGNALFLSPHYAFANGAIFSTCFADDPGFYLSGERLEWFPYAGRQHFEGNNISLHVSGATVARIPKITTSWTAQEELNRRRAGKTMDTQIGFNAYDGAFATGTGVFKLNDQHQGTFPLRITQGRGLLVGTTQKFSLGSLSLLADASYQSPFQGGTFGPRVNLTAFSDPLGGTAMSLGLGYRTDLGGQAVDRLPDLKLTFPAVQLGIAKIQQSAQAGYFMEREGSAANALLASYRAYLDTVSWYLNPSWETRLYAALGLAAYLEREKSPTLTMQWPLRQQFVVTGGIRNIQYWSEDFSTQLGIETSRTRGVSPFLFDRQSSGDRYSGAATYRLHPRWTTSLGITYYRPPNEPQPLQLADINLELSYRAPCLAWTFSLHLLDRGIYFNYSFPSS